MKGNDDVVGEPLNRVDGKLKVTGGAKFAAEFSPPNLAYGYLLQSTIANGTIASIDSTAAEAAPGVLAVITATKPATVANPPKVTLFETDIAFSGQHIGVVVAETFEQAEHAAELVKVQYNAQPPVVTIKDRFDQAAAPGRPGPGKRGDVDAALAKSAIKVEQTYHLPIEHHNPMEPHATVATWKDGGILAYDATQGVFNCRRALANCFGLDPTSVRVIDPFVGGGFGCKGQTWPHTLIAAYASQAVGRPVKIALSRRQMFSSNGYRPETFQEVQFGADGTGKLTAIRHNCFMTTAEKSQFLESTGGPASLVYSAPSAEINYRLVRTNLGSGTPMRAPGWSSGSFSNESAMDELALAASMDPLEFRLNNYADTDESTNRPWSSKHLKECYQQAAAAFGWSKRGPVGSMRQGRKLVGYGIGTASYPAHYAASSAKAKISANGSVLIQCGTQDLGTGTYTILNQIAAEALGVSPSTIRVEIADTDLPMSGGSGGSTTATSAGSAVLIAARNLRQALLALATQTDGSPLLGAAIDTAFVEDGQVRVKLASGTGAGISYQEILAKAGKDSLEAEGQANPRNAQMSGQGHTSQGFGAQFCEVQVDPDLRTIRVTRWVGAFALGRILNEKTLRSQLMGGIVWGISMGLYDETHRDEKHGRYVNTNLAEYLVPVNLDVPNIEVILIPEVDTIVSPLGAKGAGEIGITGCAGAIANAVYHATGKRVRDLPITVDKLL